jgi:hypothetical protein
MESMCMVVWFILGKHENWKGQEEENDDKEIKSGVLVLDHNNWIIF